LRKKAEFLALIGGLACQLVQLVTVHQAFAVLSPRTGQLASPGRVKHRFGLNRARLRTSRCWKLCFHGPNIVIKVTARLLSLSIFVVLNDGLLDKRLHIYI
jgi:hypothetical protein